MEDWSKRLDLFLMADDREIMVDTYFIALTGKQELAGSRSSVTIMEQEIKRD